MQYQNLVSEVIDLTSEVGAYMKNEISKVNRTDIQEKELNSLVSYVDTNSEKMLVKGLSAIVPEAGFITEEKTVQTVEKQKMWIIDPLDGTTNYLFGIPHYSTSIALQVDGEVVVGVVRDNAKEETFHAIKSGGAFLKNKPLKLTPGLEMENSIFVTGFPYKNEYEVDGLFKIIKYWLKHSRGVRRYGSAALDLCYVASGRVSCYYEAFLNIWDLAAGALIAEESGAIVSDYKAGQTHLAQGQIIASHPDIYRKVQQIIEKNLY